MMYMSIANRGATGAAVCPKKGTGGKKIADPHPFLHKKTISLRHLTGVE